MADGGQRLLDVIDDPNALESFLGGLTADSELLPSAETVDNVVASLARSLEDHEYEVDSPNETLFDTLDSSSSHLTDISRSYVPSDYGHVAGHNDAFTNNLDGFSNGNNVIRGNLSQQPEQQTPNSGCDQFIGSSNNSITSINSVINSAASSISNSTSVTPSNLKQIAASVSNCDPSKSNHYLQLTHNSVSSASNSLNFNFVQELQQQHQLNKLNVQVSTPQNQVTSLSSVSVDGQLSQNVPSNSTNNLISVVGSGNQNGVVHTLTDTTSNFQVITSQQQQQHQQSGHVNAQQNLLSNANLNTSANIQVTNSGESASSGTNAATKNETNASNINSNNNVTLSTTTNVVGSTAAAIQQSQQFIANTSSAVNQLVAAGQTVSIPSMTVSAPQLLANSQGGIVAATAGQNILQQIQTANASQSYIAMEQPTTALIATGPTTFGANVALVATGGTPTYAVLQNPAQQFLTNAIIPQSHTIQTLTKSASGAYFQTTGTPQIVTTSNVNALQNVSVATSDANSCTIVKTKQPPQLLPKPLSQVSTAVTTSAVTTTPVTSVSTSVESVNSGTTAQQSGASTPASSTSVTDSVVTQLFQQSQQQLTNVSGNAGAVAITPQQSFTIGNTAGLGQVVVSQVSSLSSMTGPQQAQLTGTIVMNQYGQPLLLPTASTSQAGTLQLAILRQQPTQPQVLTLQNSTQAGGKPIVRYLSQMPQMAQTQGYGLQQIQTANGTAYIAVRYPQSGTQTGQFQADSIVNSSAALQTQIAAATGQTQLQQLTNAQSQSVQIQLQQQQAQQILQQTSQQTQIQLQGGLAQAHIQAQQQLPQTVQQLQIQAQQQQAQSQIQQNQPGQIANAQLQQQQQQQQNQLLQQAQLSQQVLQQQQQQHTPMETQSSVQTPTQQNQYANPPNQASLPVTNQSQAQAQLSRDNEQQQISVPDSSSEPPPPKKAKTKSKSSKKKVTLDLEQLLKQSGIMDEDLNDDMSFSDFFSMDPPSNGLPASPQVPPAQIPVINTTETPKKSSSKKKSNAKKTPAQPPPPPIVTQPPPPPIVTLSPSAKPKKKSYPRKKATPAPPPPVTPPPQLLPPPPPICTTPTSSKSKSSKKKSAAASASTSESQKPETPTPTPPTPSSRSKKNQPPKKISSLDTLLATIEAVAAAAGASCASPPRVSPTPPPTTPANKNIPTPSPKSKKSKKKSAASTAPTPVKTETSLPPPVSSAPSIPPSVTSTLASALPPLSAPSLIFSQSQPTNTSQNSTLLSAPSGSPAATLLTPSQPSPRASGPNMNMTNGSTSVSTSQTGLTRVVQTIQLTPQNQQLLRNIQLQIQKLCALPKRSESEQSALQKLVVLQQQVIATGIPVPNPAHLNNLAQSVNVESINLATPCTSVPSDTMTAFASSSSANLISPSAEIDLNFNPVSSSVVTSAALSVLASLNLSSSSKPTTNSKLSSSNVPSPQPQLPISTASGAGANNSGGACVVGSPSVSSTASPDSTSNHTNNLTVEQCTTVLPHPNNTVVANTTSSSAAPHPPPLNSSTANVVNSSAGVVGNVVVSNAKADLGQLVVAPVSVASSEDKLVNKDNTIGKGSQGVLMTPSPVVPVSAPTTSNANVPSFSQHLPSATPHSAPHSAPYAPPFVAPRSAVDEKKAEELRLANLKAEEEKRARWKKEEFDMLLQRDQQYVVKPDYEVPFSSQKDAVERLMKYHIYRDRNDMNFEDFDSEFANNAGILLEKFSWMLSKYRTLLLKESMKEVGCAERVMLERMFVGEEKVFLERDKVSVAQGDVLELPPPPESWIPKIKEMVDKEMMEFEPQDPVVSQQVQSAVDSIIGCESEDTSTYLLEEGDKIEYDAFGVPINSSGYAGLSSASSADIDEAVRSILT